MTVVEIFVTTKDRKFKLIPFDPLEFSSSSINVPTSLNVKIKSDNLKQRILGIGYSFEHTSCYNLLQLSETDREKALTLLVDPIKGAGMNLWRLCIGTPDFTGTPWYSYLDEPPPVGTRGIDLINFLNENFTIEKDKDLIIPVVKQAQKINPDIKFFASPWSPPGWMKDSNSMCGGKLLLKYREVYAQYLVKFVKEYEKLGISIYAITVQNEPLHNTKDMPSCKFDLLGYEERDFIRDFLGPAFIEADLKTEIWCYDHNWDDIPGRPAKYPQNIVKDPNTAKFLGGVAFHHYSALGFSNPRLMIKHRKKMPNVPFYFTEGTLFGLWGALRLIRYFRYGCQSYNGWVPMIATDGTPNNGPFKANKSLIQLEVPEKKLTINFNHYYPFIHFSKFIKHGAYLIDSIKTRSRGFEFISFINPDNTISAILINKRRKTRSVKIEWKEQNLIVMMKPNSITTLYWKNTKLENLIRYLKDGKNTKSY